MADEVREAGADGFDLSAKLDATAITATMKTCSACHEDKPQDAFSKKAWKARQVRRCIDCTTADKPVTSKSKDEESCKGAATAKAVDAKLPLDSKVFKAYERKHGTMAALQRSGEGGDGKAYAELGYIYAHGNGVARDQETACKYWIAGAACGDVECMGTLGARYCSGNGVPLDAAEGFRYYKMAADQGCAGGIYGTAICYENGEGVEVDLDEARRLQKIALDKVHADPAGAGGKARAAKYKEDIMTALARIDSKKKGGRMGGAFVFTGVDSSGTERAFVVDLPAMKYDDKSAKGRACDSCGAPHRIGTTRLQRCQGCDKAFYCSRECQKAHRPDHRAFCKEQKAKRARTRKG